MGLFSRAPPASTAPAASLAPSSSTLPSTALTPKKAATPKPLTLPFLTRLHGKRVVLASASPRRVEILALVGLHPELHPSNFAEDLPKSSYVEEQIFEYPVETSACKAREVYERLVKLDGENPPDLVVAADTVVLKDGVILEKPRDKADQLRMLADLNDGDCQVITAVSIIHPILAAPGYKVRSLTEQTTVRFARNEEETLRAYVGCEEGLDRAGGFAVQGAGAILIAGVQGDYHNVVGFPLFSFCAFMNELVESEELEFV